MMKMFLHRNMVRCSLSVIKPPSAAIASPCCRGKRIKSKWWRVSLSTNTQKGASLRRVSRFSGDIISR